MLYRLLHENSLSHTTLPGAWPLSEVYQCPVTTRSRRCTCKRLRRLVPNSWGWQRRQRPGSASTGLLRTALLRRALLRASLLRASLLCRVLQHCLLTSLSSPAWESLASFPPLSPWYGKVVSAPGERKSKWIR